MFFLPFIMLRFINFPGAVSFCFVLFFSYPREMSFFPWYISLPIFIYMHIRPFWIVSPVHEVLLILLQIIFVSVSQLDNSFRPTFRFSNPSFAISNVLLSSCNEFYFRFYLFFVIEYYFYFLLYFLLICLISLSD